MYIGCETLVINVQCKTSENLDEIGNEKDDQPNI